MRRTQRRECGARLVGSKPSSPLEAQCSRRVHSAQVANNAGAAGYTILCIFNYCLLIILGYVRAPDTRASRPVCLLTSALQIARHAGMDRLHMLTSALSCAPRGHGADAACVLRLQEGDITAAARGRPQPEDVIPMSNV